MAAAVACHLLLLLVPLPSQDMPSRPVKPLIVDLLRASPPLRDPSLPLEEEKEATESSQPATAADPGVGAADPLASTPAPVAERPPRPAPAPEVETPSLRGLDLFDANGRPRLPAHDDSFEPGASAPIRQYGEVVSLYRPPPLRYTPTLFAEVYAPDGHVGQVAAFRYPALNVLKLFPQLAFLISPPPSRHRTCMRDADAIEDGACLDGGWSTWQTLRNRPIDD